MPGESSIDYSIIIYTYNTDERFLRRCLDAVAALDRQGLETEVILADNNSVTPAESLGFVRQAISKIPNMKGILVSQQGVKYARMEAVERARGKYIVYMDADSEPESDYLQHLKKLNTQFEQVGAWGPGNVTVQFPDEVDKSLESYARIAFGDRHDPSLKTANLTEWQSCYPSGTGLCIKATIAKEYLALIRQGTFTAEGRKGKINSDVEDVQMVMYCVKTGYHAGVSPTLSLNHLISKDRVNKDYLKKFAFDKAVCYEPSLLQVFPGRKKLMEEKALSAFSFSRQAAQKLAAAKLGAPRVFYDAVDFIGYHAGIYQALDKPLPGVVKKIMEKLK